MAGFLDHVLAEIQALEHELEADPRTVKLRELQRVRRLYEGDSTRAAAPAAVRRRGVRESSPETKQIVSAAETVLATRLEPVPTRDLYKMLVQEHGCQIGGQDPVNNLSAILSRHGFVSHGRTGWTAPNLAEPEDTAPGTDNDGAREAQERLLAPKPNGFSHEGLSA